MDMKEKIKIIKQHLNFKELPKNIKKGIIENEANSMVITFDEGVYTKKSALIDAKNHYENNDDTKYILYHSSINGLIAENEQDYWQGIEDAEWYNDA
tara:strand:- start:312 stop:602 length:291 start_codon:yes stop_codon:yes gene_type:complete